ncbi:hypothetical protein [Azospirillum largimobile]
MPHDFGSSRDRRSASAPGAGIGFHELRQACEISALREDLERLAHEAGALRDGVEQAVEDVRDRFAALSAEEMADPMVLAPLLQLAVTTLLEIREQARQLNTSTGPLADDERPSWMGAAEAPRLRPSAPPPAWGDAWDEETPPSRPHPVAHVPPSDQPTASPGDLPADLPARPAQKALAAPTAQAPVAEPFRPAAGSSTPTTAEPVSPFSPAQTPAALPAAPTPPADAQAAWLSGEPVPPPPPSRAATARSNGTGRPRPPGGIDWLGPAGR